MLLFFLIIFGLSLSGHIRAAEGASTVGLVLCAETKAQIDYEANGRATLIELGALLSLYDWKNERGVLVKAYVLYECCIKLCDHVSTARASFYDEALAADFVLRAVEKMSPLCQSIKEDSALRALFVMAMNSMWCSLQAICREGRERMFFHYKQLLDRLWAVVRPDRLAEADFASFGEFLSNYESHKFLAMPFGIDSFDAWLRSVLDKISSSCSHGESLFISIRGLVEDAEERFLFPSSKRPRLSRGDDLNKDLCQAVEAENATDLTMAPGAVADVNCYDSRVSTRLHVAAADGSYDCVNELLSNKGICLTKRDSEGNTVLHGVLCSAVLAAQFKILNDGGSTPESKKEAVAKIAHFIFILQKIFAAFSEKSISELWCFKNALNNEGKSALDIAYEKGYVIFKKYLEKLGLSRNFFDFPVQPSGAKDSLAIAPTVDACPEVLNQALFEAGQRSDKATMLALLQRGAQAVIKHRKSGKNALHFAARDGYEEVFEYLRFSAAKIDVNGCSKKGFSALHVAADHGHLGVVKNLLHCSGVRMAMLTLSGYSPLRLAVQGGHGSVVQELLRYGPVQHQACFYDNPLLFAFKPHNAGVIKALCSSRCFNFDVCDEAGDTPLHMAVATGCLDIVNILLAQEGVDVAPRNNAGDTPLHTAIATGRLDIVNILLAQEGVDVAARNNAGNTPLHVAAYRNNYFAVMALVNGGAPLGILNEKGLSALSCAAQQKSEAAVFLLLCNGASLPQESERQRTCHADLSTQNQIIFSVDAAIKKAVDFFASPAGLSLDSERRGVPCSPEDIASSCASILCFLNRHLEYRNLHSLGSLSELNDKKGPKDGDTLLHSAVAAGDRCLISVLVTLGANMNEKNDKNKTPLMKALNLPSNDCARWMIEAHARFATIMRRSSPRGL